MIFNNKLFLQSWRTHCEEIGTESKIIERPLAGLNTAQILGKEFINLDRNHTANHIYQIFQEDKLRVIMKPESFSGL